MFNLKQVWGLNWPWESHDSVKAQVILDNTCTMDSCIVPLKDECSPMPMGVGHNNRLTGIASAVEPTQ